MIKGFIAGVVVANAFEWFAHKYVLHGVHRKGKTRFSPVPKNMQSHWEHHREVRKQAFGDAGYNEGLSNWRTRNELLSIVIAAGTFSVITYKFSKGFALSNWYCAANYFYVHRRAHLEPEWAKKTIPWHYDHHMNANQDANWCVTKPWFDYVMGTRVISSDDLKEQNPLGIILPEALANLIAETVEGVFPVKWVEKNKLQNVISSDQQADIHAMMQEAEV